MRIAFVMPGLHRVRRGAEVALESVAARLAASDEVTLIGTGPERPGAPYRYLRGRAIRRERFERLPGVPLLRTPYAYEELSWVPSLLGRYRPRDFDVALGCSFPFTHWVLQTRGRRRQRPALVFVTQNGDWPAYADRAEYRLFRCDGLVCTNPVYEQRNRQRWFSTLIPNGVDVERFGPAAGNRARFGLPEGVPVVLMVSALVDAKRVLETMRVSARIPDAHFVVAGDGPLRDRVDALAAELLPHRFRRLELPGDEMPELYRCADVFVHASRWESFGNIYVEALATGLPVVADDNAVSRWVLEEHATLVDGSDDDALLEGLGRALAAGRLGAAERVAYARRRFGLDAVARAYRRFLAQVVERRRAELG